MLFGSDLMYLSRYVWIKDVFQPICQKTFLVGNNFILLRLGEKCLQTPGLCFHLVILIVHSIAH